MNETKHIGLFLFVSGLFVPDFCRSLNKFYAKIEKKTD